MAKGQDQAVLDWLANAVNQEEKPVNPLDNISKSDDKARIGIYFSAHWCPPCRGFTPMLVEYYNKQKKEAPGTLEIVFVSSDRDEASFKGYFAEMPWLAIPFGKPTVDELKKKYGIRGIPTFVLIKKDGSTDTDDGRGTVMKYMK